MFVAELMELKLQLQYKNHVFLLACDESFFFGTGDENLDHLKLTDIEDEFLKCCKEYVTGKTRCCEGPHEFQ